ncbi:hypothetical protein [Nostoc sp.]|uniref:hypothetical protein n=1 Tax=Nostoc sp. TaxID=1180 RepID=UPI002FF84E2B
MGTCTALLYETLRERLRSGTATCTERRRGKPKYWGLGTCTERLVPSEAEVSRSIGDWGLDIGY